MLENINLSTAVLAGMIMGFVEVAKWAGLPSKYAGVLAVALGLILGGISYFAGVYPLANSLISGAVLGLTAAGVYSGTKAVISK